MAVAAVSSNCDAVQIVSAVQIRSDVCEGGVDWNWRAVQLVRNVQTLSLVVVGAVDWYCVLTLQVVSRVQTRSDVAVFGLLS